MILSRAHFAAVLVMALVASVTDSRGDPAFEGRCVAVYDGDTIAVLVGERTVKVRLAGIDTPERGQPWASRSKQALAARAFWLGARVSLYDWEDPLRVNRDATSFTYVVGPEYRYDDVAKALDQILQ